MSEPPLSDADVAYVRENFVTLEELCETRGESADELRKAIARGEAPRPSYVLPDGTEMVPTTYVTPSREEFERQYLGAGGEPAELEDDWAAHLDGVYGVCLLEPTPENIVRKGALVRRIEALLAEPRPDDEEWRGALRRDVDALDALERPFSPDYDRVQFGRPPTRDTLIAAPRREYADVFEPARA